jgi:hypothetical protein
MDMNIQLDKSWSECSFVIGCNLGELRESEQGTYFVNIYSCLKGEYFNWLVHLLECTINLFTPHSLLHMYTLVFFKLTGRLPGKDNREIGGLLRSLYTLTFVSTAFSVHASKPSRQLIHSHDSSGGRTFEQKCSRMSYFIYDYNRSRTRIDVKHRVGFSSGWWLRLGWVGHMCARWELSS